MFKLNGKMYFAGPDGALLTDGKYKIGDYYYGLTSRVFSFAERP